MNEQGYRADIDALRKLHPSLLTFDAWISKGYWRGGPNQMDENLRDPT